MAESHEFFKVIGVKRGIDLYGLGYDHLGQFHADAHELADGDLVELVGIGLAAGLGHLHERQAKLFLGFAEQALDELFLILAYLVL